MGQKVKGYRRNEKYGKRTNRQRERREKEGEYGNMIRMCGRTAVRFRGGWRGRPGGQEEDGIQEGMKIDMTTIGKDMW